MEVKCNLIQEVCFVEGSASLSHALHKVVEIGIAGVIRRGLATSGSQKKGLAEHLTEVQHTKHNYSNKNDASCMIKPHCRG